VFRKLIRSSFLGVYSHIGNHFDIASTVNDGASVADTASVYQDDLGRRRRHDDDDGVDDDNDDVESTIDGTLSLASVPVGISARDYLDNDLEAELPTHACA